MDKKRRRSNELLFPVSDLIHRCRDGGVVIKKSKKLCEDWTTCSYPRKKDGWDFFKIPANTILFHGTAFDFPDDIVPNTPTFLATLKSAGFYAFRQDFRRGPEGKIITLKTNRRLRILDMSSVRNVKRLQKLFKKKYPKDAEHLQSAFSIMNDIVIRKSHRSWDGPVTRRLCKLVDQTDLVSLNLDGWGYPNIQNFHDEIVLCKNDGMTRYKIEYRFTADTPSCVYVVTGVNQKIKRVMYPETVGDVHFRKGQQQSNVDPFSKQLLLKSSKKWKSVCDEMRKFKLQKEDQFWKGVRESKKTNTTLKWDSVEQYWNHHRDKRYPPQTSLL